MNTGKSITTILGQCPPGQGDSPKMISIGPPVISRNPRDWDTCEETLWVANLNLTQLADGYDRGTSLKLAGYISSTGVMRVAGYKIIGFKAGCPVITLTCKGWISTKANNYAYRRNTTGDTVTNLVLGGFAYAVLTYFTTTVPVGNYNASQAPGASVAWGMANTIIAPNYSTSWPYNFIGVTPGWFLASREVDTIPGSTVSRTVDTFSGLMNNNGLAF